MSLLHDLKAEIDTILSKTWNVAQGRVVPDPAVLKLSNDARHFDRATVLYADLSGSTNLVNTKDWQLAGEIYKTYLYCAAKVIRNLGGEITSYDGDRVMAVFIGNSQTSNAAKCGLQINWAVKKIINPSLKIWRPNSNYVVEQVVGIDTGELRVARIGIRGGNDLVWIGRAANYAAKLTECNNNYPTWITQQAYEKIADWAKYAGNPKMDMWIPHKWNTMGGLRIYGSSYTWMID